MSERRDVIRATGFCTGADGGPFPSAEWLSADDRAGDRGDSHTRCRPERTAATEQFRRHRVNGCRRSDRMAGHSGFGLPRPGHLPASARAPARSIRSGGTSCPARTPSLMPGDHRHGSAGSTFGGSSHSSPGSSTVSARSSFGDGGPIKGVTTLPKSVAGPTLRLAAASRNAAAEGRDRRKPRPRGSPGWPRSTSAPSGRTPTGPGRLIARSRSAMRRDDDRVLAAGLGHQGRSDGRQPRNIRAVSYAPVSTTVATRGSVTRARPSSPSGHGWNCSTSRGTPADHK